MAPIACHCLLILSLSTTGFAAARSQGPVKDFAIEIETSLPLVTPSQTFTIGSMPTVQLTSGKSKGSHTTKEVTTLVTRQTGCTDPPTHTTSQSSSSSSLLPLASFASTFTLGSAPTSFGTVPIGSTFSIEPLATMPADENRKQRMETVTVYTTVNELN